MIISYLILELIDYVYHFQDYILHFHIVKLFLSDLITPESLLSLNLLVFILNHLDRFLILTISYSENGLGSEKNSLLSPDCLNLMTLSWSLTIPPLILWISQSHQILVL